MEKSDFKKYGVQEMNTGEINSTEGGGRILELKPFDPSPGPTFPTDLLCF